MTRFFLGQSAQGRLYRLPISTLAVPVQESLAARATLEGRAFYDLIPVAQNVGFVFSGLTNLGDWAADAA